jgi:hypothetical protein
MFFMVYLIYFSEKLHHAQRYLGLVAGDLMQRFELHRANRGAKLLTAVNNNGINWQVVRVRVNGDRSLKRTLKNYRKSRCFCPVCSQSGKA